VAARAVQALLGSFTALAVYLLGSRISGRPAGLIGGMLAAFNGPLIFYELAFLRSGLQAFLYTTLILILWPGKEKPGWTRSAAAGAVFGLGLLTEATSAVMAPIIIWWAAASPSDKAPAKRFAPLLGRRRRLFPDDDSLVARNLAAEAPAFSLTRRGALEFINGNLPGAPSAGWSLTPSTLDMVSRADRKLIPAVFLVLDYYRTTHRTRPQAGRKNRGLPWGLRVPQQRQLLRRARILDSL